MPINVFIQRLAFTIGALVVYRVGCAIPAPGLDAQSIALMSGTPSMELVSIFALGVTPIFSALLVFEFLKLIFFPLSRWEAAERTNARRLHNVIYVVVAAVAAIQAYGVAVAIHELPRAADEAASVLPITVTMTAGVMLLGWLADRITRYGLGTGFWLILIVPTLIALPSTVAVAVDRVHQGAIIVDTLVVVSAFLLVVLTAATAMVLYDRKSRIVPAAADKPQYRISGPDFALVWPPLFGGMLGDFGMSMLSWPESVAAQHTITAALILMFAGFQTLGTVRNDGPGERLRPWIIAAAQIFICIGCDIVGEALKMSGQIKGYWFIVIVVTMMNLLRDHPPTRWLPLPKAESA